MKIEVNNIKYNFCKVASISELLDEYINNGTIENHESIAKQKLKNNKGVYLVVANKNALFTRNPIDIKDKENDKYKCKILNRILKCEDNYIESGYRVIYVGKAGGKKGVKGRIKQYIYSYNKQNPVYRGHRGGRAIWQIGNKNNIFLFIYYEQEKQISCEELESELINKFGIDNLINMRK